MNLKEKYSKDPYLYDDLCIQRLTKEWLEYGKIIVAVDFDDTIYDFHGRGYEYNEIVESIKIAKVVGAYICIFTGSNPDKYDFIRQYCQEKFGFPIDSINENPIPLPFGNNGKMYYNILLDDRAGLRQASLVLLKSALNVMRKE